MIGKRFDQVEKDDIDGLVANAVREGRTIEYKEKLPSGKDEDKKEFLADVSSFANASGGDLLYGIEETRDSNGKPTGIPKGVNGLSGINVDQEIRRLEQMIRDGIEPRIPGVQIKSIDGFPGGPVVFLRLPRSWASPHMVTFKASPRFFSRTSAGKSPLDVPEIRAAFVQSAALPERIRSFREDRIGRILSDETPLRLVAGSRLVFHIIPVMSFYSGSNFDVANNNQVGMLGPMGTSGWNGRLNLDGFVSFSGAENENTCAGYSQLFRNGIIEAVDVMNCWTPAEYKNNISSLGYEKKVIRYFNNSLGLYADLGVEPPLTLMLSMIGIKGHALYVEGHSFSRVPTVMDRDVLLIPELVVEDITTPPEKILRPIFDLVWQSFGFNRSFNYNDRGEWSH